MNPPSPQRQHNNSPARDRYGPLQAFSRARRRKQEDDGDNNAIPNSGRTHSDKSRRKSIAVNRPGETFTARDRPFSSASHTSLKAAFEATKSLPLEPRSPLSSRGSRTSLLSSPEQQKKSYIPVRARQGQAEARTTNGMASQGSGRRSPLAPRAQMSRARGSSSSPPRGLREAYARIVDEENLAAEESAVSEMGDEQDESPADWSSPHYVNPKELRDQDRARLERIQTSESPLSLPRPRPSSPPSGLRSLEKPAGLRYQDLDDGILDSGSASMISGLSSLENGTDDSFARTLARHARDQQRINGALKSENRVFSRARNPERAVLTSENLRRNDKVDEIMAAEREVAEEAISVSSDLSDIPVRVPKEWGRRGRKKNDWLSKIQEAEDAESRRKSDVRERDEASSIGRVGLSRPEESTIDWVAAAADVPLPSVENKAPNEVEPHQTVTPPPSREQTTSVERVEQPHVEDESISRSLLISSKPSIRSNNIILDRIRDREIEALKGQAVTTSRLGELKERTSKEQLRPRRASGQIGEKDGEDHPIVKSRGSFLGLDSHDSIPNSSQEKKRDDGSEPTKDKSDEPLKSPVGNSKGSEETKSMEKKEETSNDKPSDNAPPNRGKSEQGKADPRDLLLRLARAASSSPSPTLRTQGIHKRTLSEEVNRNGESQKQYGPTPSEDKSAVNSGEAVKLSGDAIQNATKDSDTGDSTPKAGEGTTESQTPALAIGGWVNTPITTSVAPNFSPGISSSPLYRRSSGLTDDPEKDGQVDQIRIGLQRTISAPEPDRRPTQGSYRQLEAEIESTIDSIDRLIANNEADITSLLQNEGPGSNRFEIGENKDKLLGDSKGGKQPEVLAYERTNKRLQTLRLNIHDAKKSREDIENQVQQTTSTGQPGAWSCSHCGHLVAVHPAGEDCHHGHLQLPFPLPQTHRWKEGSRRPRLTWLGVICMILAIIYGYFLAEQITCELFCPKHIEPNDISNNPKYHRLGLYTLYHGEGYYAVWPPYAIWGTLRWAFPGYINPLAYQLCRTSRVARSTMKQTCQELCVWNDCGDGPETEEELWQGIQETNEIYVQGIK